MPVSTDTDLLIKAFKIEDKGAPIGVWLYYDTTKEILRTTRVNANIAYLGDFLRPPMTPSEIFVRQIYSMTLSFSTDFNLGGLTNVVSANMGRLISSSNKNNISVYYKPPKLSDVFTFTLYSSDDSTNKIVVLPITILPVDVVPESIQYNPTINTRNNKYENLTMLFSEGGATGGILTTSAPDSFVSNVSFSDGKCTFDYTTPGSTGSDNLIFSKIIAADIQYENKGNYLFPITNLLEQPNFSNWVYTPSSQSFPYTNTDSLIAVFNKDIKTCTSITATSGSPTTIVPISISGKQVKFEWTSLQTGSVTFTFNGLTSVDGSIDANVDGDTFVGPINLYTPPTIVGWNGVQPTEENTTYNLSVTFNKPLSNLRIPIITATENVSPVFTGVTGSQVNFSLTTSSSPSTTIYTLSNVSASDGSIKIVSNISAGAKINSVQVETDLNSSFLTMSKLVIGRTQKVKIILSKPINGDLSFVSNPNCTFSPSITMIDRSTAQFTILPNPNTSLTIQTNNIITQDLSESVLSHTFNLVYEQTIVNLFESSNKHIVKTTFDVGTTVALSLQVSKPIGSDLGTTITCSNATVANVTISNNLENEKYYYNFDFTPTKEITNQTINVNQAKDLNNFKYNLSQSGLTFINPYTFATAFNFSATNKNRYYGQGYLSQGLSSSLILTFTGGDNLHSNSVATQVSYVTYIQDSQEYNITNLSCSTEENTITINSITPLSSNNLTIKVVLKSPNGIFFSNEIIGTILTTDFANPITSVNVTSPIPSPNKLVYNSSVNLSFNFNTASAFSSQVLSSFSATVNDNTLPLTFATVSGVSLIVPYAAVSTSKHTFVFSAFNQQFTFVIESSEIYTYPTIIKTTRNIPTVTLGEYLTLTSHFLSVLPSFMTSSVIVTPFGYSSPSPFVQTYVGTISAGSLLDVTTPTWYYPFTTNIQNYASGVAVTDATIGVGGNTTGGNATFNDGLVLTGSSIHNAPGASYIVLPSTSSGNTAAFSCWFKSNNNGSYTRIIDMATNGSFRLYVIGSNRLNFNDVYSFTTATTINNNTWNFIAINATATTLSWVLNSGDAGNYGSGSISSKPVNFNNSVGYLGHSFGGDPEFAGSLKQVCFYANTNLTSQQISALYMGTTRVSISHKVEKDVNHSASVTLNYGSTNNPYNWGSDTLTSSNIYTFPDTFIIDGTSNGYVGGAYLKAGATGSLKLTFSGGDMLYSDSASTQISYVKYVQSGVTGVIPPNLLSTSDLLETITISGIKPTDTNDLTIAVKLIGPDGSTGGAEISKTVFTSQFEVVVVPLGFRTAGGIQNTTSTGTLLLNGTQWKNASTSLYQAAVINKAFIGNFTIVIKFGSDYSVLAMLCSQYASPMDFKDINRDYYSASYALQNFQPSGAYSYSIPIHFYNSSSYYGNAFANTSTTHYKYTRSGNYISISYCNTSATGPWTLISSATIQSTDLVICLIGQCWGANGANQIATVISENYSQWNPSQITTDLWLDASDSTTLTSVSGFISEWRDKSGNSRNAVQPIVGYRPSTSALNNLTTLTFDGIDDNMNIPTTILRTQSKPNIFYVFVPNNNNSNNGYSPEITFNSTNNGDNGSFHYVKSNLLGASYPMYTAGGWGNYDNLGSAYVYGSAEIISFITLTSSYQVYRNGILEGGSSAGNALSNSTGLQLAQQQGYRTSGISFAEIVLVFGASTETIQLIEGYLAWKWGLVSKLPSTHPYKSAKP